MSYLTTTGRRHALAAITIPIHESVLARIDADPTILERLMQALTDILNERVTNA